MGGLRRAWRVCLGLLVGCLVLSTASAQQTALSDSLFGEGNTGKIERYQIRDVVRESDTLNENFTNLKLHTYDLGPAGFIYRINVQATYIFQLSSDGTWEYQLTVNDTPIEDCRWLVRTIDPGGFLSGDLAVYPYFDVDCTASGDAIAGISEGDTVTFNVTRTAIFGAPDEPIAASTGVVIERADFIQTGDFETMNSLESALGLESLEAIAVFGLFFTAAIFWMRSTDVMVRVASSSLVLLLFAVAIANQATAASISLAAIFGLSGGWMLFQTFADYATAKVKP